MPASTTKKVMVRRFDREAVAGYCSPQSYLQPAGVELMTQEGTVAMLPYSDVKSVSFVKDFEAGAQEPERKTFQTRPKMGGLWVRMKFRDNDEMEGILSNNLLQIETHGFTVTPPDPYANNQRVFVPKAALTAIEVLGVVGSPLKRRKPKPAEREQIGLFE